MELGKIEGFLTAVEAKFPDHVRILGISGWGDSTLLAWIIENLLEKKIISPSKIILANVDHGQRKEASYEQQQIQKKWGKVFDVRVHKLNKGKLSEDEMRNERQRFFESIAQEQVQPSLLFLWHNLTDRIETTILNILRGTGIKWFLNMKKIDYQPDDKKIKAVIRPLLDISREEIRGFLKDHWISFFEDSTNKDITVSKRNLVREYMMQFFDKYAFKKNLFYHSWKQIYKELEQKIEGKIPVDLIPLPDIWIGGKKYLWFKTIIDPLEFDVGRLQNLLKNIEAYQDITQNLLRELLVFIIATKRGTKYFKGRNLIKHNQILYLIKGPYKFWHNWATPQDMEKMYGITCLPPHGGEMLASWLSVSKWIKKNKIPIFLRNILPVERKKEGIYILKEKLWKFM